MTTTADLIVGDVARALNIEPGVSGCPEDVALVAAGVALRAAATYMQRPGAEILAKWADELDARPVGEPGPDADDGAMLAWRAELAARLAQLDARLSAAGIRPAAAAKRDPLPGWPDPDARRSH